MVSSRDRSSPMGSGLLPSYILMGTFFLCSDEAGDLGVDLSKTGCTKTYVPLVFFVSPKFQDPLYSALKKSFKKIAGTSPKSWKDLPSRIKNDDDLLRSLIDDFDQELSSLNPKGKLTHLLSACVLDKKELLQDSTLAQIRTYRMAWGYGLIFKRLGKYLANSGHSVIWKIDQNANPEIINLKGHINREIPKLKNFTKTYNGPCFAKPAEKRYIKVADFFAGITRVVSEDVILNCTACEDFEEGCNEACMALKYPLLANSFFEIFNANIYRKAKLTWQWRGFLYHPIAARAQYEHIFPYDEYTR